MIELENKAALTDDLKELAEYVIQTAKQKGATAAEVNIDKGTGLSVEARMGNVDKLEYHRDQGASVTVYFGHQKGLASSGDLSKAALDNSIDAACRIARYTSEDTYNGLADAELMATEFPDLALYHPWDLDADHAIQRAIETEKVARDVDSRITNSDGSSVDSYAGLSVYANSHGFCGVSTSTHHSASCVLVAQEGESMQRDYWYTLSRRADELESAEAVGLEAAKRTLQRLNARSLSSREAKVMFAPSTARTLIGSLISAVSGGSQYRKATFLPDSVGQQLFPEFVQLREDPFLVGGLSSRSFDGEGVATQARDIIKDGVLQGYVLGSYSARKLGLQTTGNAGGTHNLMLSSTGQNYDQILAEMGTGLLVTELMGNGNNPMTGDYSRGAAGYWVENGEIQYPVEEITIASNLKDMFLGVLAIGTDVDYRSATLTGSILIDKMMIAGQ